jgi:hypothetical protein
MVEAMPGEPAHQPFLGLAQQWWTKSAAVKRRHHLFALPPLDQSQVAQHAIARPDCDPAAGNPPVERGAVAQHSISMTGDLRPVLGADISAVPEVIGRNIVGRPIPGVDSGKNLNRCSDLCSGCQAAVVILASSPSPRPSPRRRGARGAKGRFPLPACAGRGVG